MTTGTVVKAIGAALAAAGVRRVFGLVGASNFTVTDALVANGVRFVAARHESGAVTMADGYSRLSDDVPVVSVNIGNGLTNSITALTEAAKSHTPLVVLMPDAHAGRASTTPAWADASLLAAAAGAEYHQITTAASAVFEATRAYRRAAIDGATVVLSLPQDLLSAEAPTTPRAAVVEPHGGVVASPADVARLAEQLAEAQRPVFIAGRGARGHRAALTALADRVGALLSTSIAARGLFASDPWDLDVAGGFSTTTTAELIAEADLVVGWGAGLNPWTLRHGALVGEKALLVQVDHDARALDKQPRVDSTVLGDVEATARAVLALLPDEPAPGYRDRTVAERIAAGARWRDVPFDPIEGPGVMDPRTLTLELDRILPVARLIVPDIGNFSTYPALFPQVPDECGVIVPIGFGCLGLGLSTAIGASLARPDRLTVACLGDGGLMMSAVELDTVVREQLPLLVVVYNDNAYGAESEQFAPLGYDVSTVVFPDTDIAAIARGYGWDAITARTAADLAPLREWVEGPRSGPLLVDAKISSFPSFLMTHVHRAHAGAL